MHVSYLHKVRLGNLSLNLIVDDLVKKYDLSVKCVVI